MSSMDYTENDDTTKATLKCKKCGHSFLSTIRKSEKDNGMVRAKCPGCGRRGLMFVEGKC